LAETALADTGFIIALLRARDAHHPWAAAQAKQFAPPWQVCEPVLTEAFHFMSSSGARALAALMRRRSLVLSFRLDQEQDSVLALMGKYIDVPMSLADACLVRMSETHADPIVLTTDAHFRIYRRHSRQVVPCVIPN
jgi:predicted nucleic acid-binding protein